MTMDAVACWDATVTCSALCTLLRSSVLLRDGACAHKPQCPPPWGYRRLTALTPLQHRDILMQSIQYGHKHHPWRHDKKCARPAHAEWLVLLMVLAACCGSLLLLMLMMMMIMMMKMMMMMMIQDRH